MAGDLVANQQQIFDLDESLPRDPSAKKTMANTAAFIRWWPFTETLLPDDLGSGVKLTP